MNILGRKINWDNPEEVREYNKTKWKKYKERNIKKIKIANNKYQKENKNKFKFYRKKYRGDNKGKIQAYSKKYREDNIEKEKARKKKYREKNSKKIKAIMKNYRENNKGKIIEYREKRKNEMKKYNEEYREQNKKVTCIICGNPATKKYCSVKCRSIGNKGKDSPNWRGGITPLHRKIRNSKEYALWRTAVFERDDYTCIWCGQCGGTLNADHIKPFALYPELRFAIDNGRTLCEECHRTTDTYGVLSKKNNKGDINGKKKK